MNDNMIPKEFKKYSKNCGNWAGYDYRSGLSYCGWMDCHNDLNGQGATNSKPWFEIKIMYGTSKGRLVHKVNGKLIATRLRKGMLLKFDASKNHAFVNVELADKIVKNQKFVKESKNWGSESTQDTQVRLVWKFVE